LGSSDRLALFAVRSNPRRRHLSAAGYPIRLMFGFNVGFSGSSNRVALFPFQLNLEVLENFRWPYLCNGSSDPLLFGFRVGFSRLCGFSVSTSVLTKSKRRPHAVLKISNECVSGIGCPIHFHEIVSSFAGI